MSVLEELHTYGLIEPVDADDPLERASVTWRQVVATRGRFTVHAADPLAGVAYRVWRFLARWVAPAAG